MKLKLYGSIIIGVIIVILGLICFTKTLHVNDIDKIQIIQSISGDITVRRDGGWYTMICPKIWEYPKASVEICNDKDKDAILMQFSNKSLASLSCQIGYRIDGTNDAQIIKLHQLVEGLDSKLWQIVRTSLQTAAQRIASQYTPSESVEKFDEFQTKIATAIIHDKDLLEMGIDVVSFTCAGLPKYDDETINQFNKQKIADLNKRLAESEKIQYEAETIKMQASYKKQIAEQQGQADAITAKLKTEAEREKELAEISARKQVEVARLEKERAEIEVEKLKAVAKIEAEKLLAVAEVQKKTEKENLEAVELRAKQTIAEAEAKKIAVDKSGAITEIQKAELDLQREIQKCKWEALGRAIGNIKLPTMMNISSPDAKGSSNGTVNSLDALIQTLTLEKLKNVSTTSSVDSKTTTK